MAIEKYPTRTAGVCCAAVSAVSQSLVSWMLDVWDGDVRQWNRRWAVHTELQCRGVTVPHVSLAWNPRGIHQRPRSATASSTPFWAKRKFLLGKRKMEMKAAETWGMSLYPASTSDLAARAISCRSLNSSWREPRWMWWVYRRHRQRQASSAGPLWHSLDIAAKSSIEKRVSDEQDAYSKQSWGFPEHLNTL